MGNGNFSGQGANGNGNGSGNQGAQGGAGGDGSGDAPEYVTKTDFDAVVKKLDDVLADNKRYRDERRKNQQQNASGNGNQGDDSRDGNGGNDVTNEMATLKNQLRQANFRTDITTAAIKAGALVPEDIHRLISIDSDDVDIDDLGYVRNADEVIDALKKSRPQYFGNGNQPLVLGGVNGGNGSGNRQRRKTTFSDQIRDDMAARTGRRR